MSFENFEIIKLISKIMNQQKLNNFSDWELSYSIFICKRIIWNRSLISGEQHIILLPVTLSLSLLKTHKYPGTQLLMTENSNALTPPGTPPTKDPSIVGYMSGIYDTIEINYEEINSSLPTFILIRSNSSNGSTNIRSAS